MVGVRVHGGEEGRWSRNSTLTNQLSLFKSCIRHVGTAYSELRYLV